MVAAAASVAIVAGASLRIGDTAQFLVANGRTTTWIDAATQRTDASAHARGAAFAQSANVIVVANGAVFEGVVQALPSLCVTTVLCTRVFVIAIDFLQRIANANALRTLQRPCTFVFIGKGLAVIAVVAGADVDLGRASADHTMVPQRARVAVAATHERLRRVDTALGGQTQVLGARIGVVATFLPNRHARSRQAGGLTCAKVARDRAGGEIRLVDDRAAVGGLLTNRDGTRRSRKASAVAVADADGLIATSMAADRIAAGRCSTARGCNRGANGGTVAAGHRGKADGDTTDFSKTAAC